MFVVRILFSLAAIALGAVHLFVPSVEVDAITLTCLLAAAVPWLSSIFKSIGTPGGWKIEYQDLALLSQRASEAGLLSDKGNEEYSFQQVSESDPNLALAGLRIELEKRLREMAAETGIRTRRGIGQSIGALATANRLSEEQKSILLDILPLLNGAVHGADVDPRAYDWAIETGVRLLNALDQENSGDA